ncbi:hypothetical protein [Kitasatospora phosalacinea]|uniref:Uncharacterized protein n=1 Tax=Kitasatospora phosalacinea TaxID=2065 RepID=A0ABW6GVY8_9ACTN
MTHPQPTPTPARPPHRHVRRLLSGYLLFAVTVSAAPAVLHRPVVGHLSWALLLLALQLALTVRSVADHRRDAQEPADARATP